MANRPRGRPKKIIQQPQPLKEATFNESVGVAGNMGDNTDFSPDERMSVYQEAAKQLYPDDVTVAPPETEGKKETEKSETEGESKTQEVEESQKVAIDVAVEEPKKDELTSADTASVQATDKKPEDVRTVPYGALHEERMKRKDLQREVDDVKAKMNQLIEDNVKLMSKGKEPSEDEYEPVYKGELNELRAENFRLKSKIEAVENRFQSDDIRKKADEVKNMMDKVDQEESASGRPGFSKIGWRLVLDEINEVAKTDPELAETYRTPDGWKLIHAKKFPEVQAIYIAQAKKEVFDQKKQAKTGAELVTATGKAPVKEAPEKEWKWDDYLKMRQNLNL